MAKVYVHIGLPKTATTSLQEDVFPVLEQQGVRYLGVRQPRAQAQQDPLFDAVMGAVRSGLPVSAVREDLRELSMSRTGPVLISDEMITVSSGGSDWRDALGNLSELLQGLDYGIIVTVREPVAALFSFYVELYKQFSRAGQSFESLALHDPRMHIFHYRKLFDRLEELFDRERILVKRFEELTVGGHRDIINALGVVAPAELPDVLTKRNSRESDKDRVKTRYSRTAGDLLRLAARPLGLLGMPRQPWLSAAIRPLIARMDRAKIGRLSVPRLTREQSEKLRHELADETSALKRFLVSYD